MRLHRVWGGEAKWENCMKKQIDKLRPASRVRVGAGNARNFVGKALRAPAAPEPPVIAGDLLSDEGYIVFDNLELLNAFAPANAPSDIGLDALYVVTDATPPTQAPRLAIQVNTSKGSAVLAWQGQGRVFQVERAADVTGPFRPLSPILPDLSFDDSGTLTNRAQSYYRLRQW